MAGTFELAIRTVEAAYLVSGDHKLPAFVTVSVFSFWLSWSIGAYLAECHASKRTSWFAKTKFDVAFAIVIALPLFKPSAPFAFCGFAVLTGIVVDRLLYARRSLPRARTLVAGWAHLRALGAISYSFYLIHLPILAVTRLLVTRALPESSIHPLTIFILCCAWYPVIYILSYLLWRIVELPSIALGNRAWRRIIETRRGG